MTPKFQSDISAKAVANNHNVVCCYISEGHFLSSPKKIIQENNLAFLDDESETSVKIHCLTPDEFYNGLSTTSPTSNLYLYMNIFSLPYHFNDLKYLDEICQNKPNVNGITECRLRANRIEQL